MEKLIDLQQNILDGDRPCIETVLSPGSSFGKLDLRWRREDQDNRLFDANIEG